MISDAVPYVVCLRVFTQTGSDREGTLEIRTSGVGSTPPHFIASQVIEGISEVRLNSQRPEVETLRLVVRILMAASNGPGVDERGRITWIGVEGLFKGCNGLIPKPCSYQLLSDTQVLVARKGLVICSVFDSHNALIEVLRVPALLWGVVLGGGIGHGAGSCCAQGVKLLDLVGCLGVHVRELIGSLEGPA